MFPRILSGNNSFLSSPSPAPLCQGAPKLLSSHSYFTGDFLAKKTCEKCTCDRENVLTDTGPIVVQLSEQLGDPETNRKVVHGIHRSDSLHHWFAYLIWSQTELIGIISTNKLLERRYWKSHRHKYKYREYLYWVHCGCLPVCLYKSVVIWIH